VRSSGPLYPWLLVVALTSLVAAMATAMLKTSLGAPTADAILSAGAAFGGAFGLGLGILSAVRSKQ